MAKASTRGFDAGREHLGYVYGHALLGAAEKVGATDQVREELAALVEVLEQLPNLRAALAAPKVAAEDKDRMIDKAFGSRVSRVLLHGLKVLSRHGRLDCIADVRTAYDKLYNELRGRVEVQVRVAAPIGDEQTRQIAEAIGRMLKKAVDVKVEVRPEILGGIVVKVGDTLYDGSVIAKLDQMRGKALASTERQLRQSLDRFVAV